MEEASVLFVCVGERHKHTLVFLCLLARMCFHGDQSWNEVMVGALGPDPELLSESF